MAIFCLEATQLGTTALNRFLFKSGSNVLQIMGAASSTAPAHTHIHTHTHTHTHPAILLLSMYYKHIELQNKKL